MPHSEAIIPKRGRNTSRRKVRTSRGKIEQRFSIGLPPLIVNKVERYAETLDISMSRAVATLVRLGLESQESRKQEFFKRLKKNLANDDPKTEDRVVDDFRALILGH
jgi:uncharacterized protein YlaN (UPF0358 family)